MVKRMSTFRRKTRYKLKKSPATRGKIKISEYLKELSIGEEVLLKAEPAVQKGFFHPRYQGRTGLVVGKKSSCYEVLVNDAGKEKKLIIHPVHLKKLNKD